MTVYAIYHYDFRKTRESALKFEDSKETTLDRAQEVFEGLLRGVNPLRLTNTKRDGTLSVLENEVLAKHDKATLLLVCNEKYKKYQDKKDDKEFEYYPGCYVIIDNREDVANIAIERVNAFENNPDKVCALLQDAINLKLNEYGLEIEIRPKIREASVWDIVEHQTNEFKDSIKKVVFNFPILEDVKGVDATKKMRKKLNAMATLGKAFNAAKASYQVEAHRNSTLRMDKTQEDMAQMVELCTTNAYDIHIYFRYYGVYRFGADERALCSLEDKIILDFKDNQTMFDEDGNSIFELSKWLDSIRHIIEGYKDGIPTPKKRKKSRQE